MVDVKAASWDRYLPNACEARLSDSFISRPRLAAGRTVVAKRAGRRTFAVDLIIENKD